MKTPPANLTVGATVRVKPGPGDWRSDWRGEYVVVGIAWEYQTPGDRLNIAIASEDEIARGYGSTDGFRVEDLEVIS